jgi:hypothetical protein
MLDKHKAGLRRSIEALTNIFHPVKSAKIAFVSLVLEKKNCRHLTVTSHSVPPVSPRPDQLKRQPSAAAEYVMGIPMMEEASIGYDAGTDRMACIEDTDAEEAKWCVTAAMIKW